jgi:tetratricopeptide (TPR) repeat protein
MVDDRYSRLNRAKFLAMSNSHDEAIAILNSVLADDQNDIEALRLKGNAIELRELQAFAANGTGGSFSDEFSEAGTCYEKILTVDPFNVMALIDLGTHWKNRSEIEKALKYYSQAEKLIKQRQAPDDFRDELIEVLEGQLEISEQLGEIEQSKAISDELTKIRVTSR